MRYITRDRIIMSIVGGLIGATVVLGLSTMFTAAFNYSDKIVERNYTEILIDFQSNRIRQLAEELRQEKKRVLLCEGYTDE